MIKSEPNTPKLFQRHARTSGRHQLTPSQRSTSTNLLGGKAPSPPKSILRPPVERERKKKINRSRSVLFDEENVLKTSKRKKARELCDQAFAELGEGNQEGFLSCIENAINADERFAYPWNLKGVMYADNLDKFEEALECYKKALLLDPNYVDAWNNKGFALQSLGRVEDAQLCYKSAEDAKKKVEALKGLKRAQLRLGNDLEDKVAKIIETSESSDMTLDSPKSPVGSSKNSLEEIPRLDCSLPKTISFSSHNVTTSFVTSSILENNSPSKLIKASENNMPSKPQKISSEPPSSEVIISDFSLKRVITLSPFTESISEEEETKIDFPNFEDITNHRNKVAIQSQQTIIT